MKTSMQQLQHRQVRMERASAPVSPTDSYISCRGKKPQKKGPYPPLIAKECNCRQALATGSERFPGSQPPIPEMQNWDRLGKEARPSTNLVACAEVRGGWLPDSSEKEEKQTQVERGPVPTIHVA